MHRHPDPYAISASPAVQTQFSFHGGGVSSQFSPSASPRAERTGAAARAASMVITSHTPTKAASSFSHSYQAGGGSSSMVAGSLGDEPPLPSSSLSMGAAAGAQGQSAMLAQLVQKVSTFRRQLVAEKQTSAAQAEQLAAQADQLAELEQRLKEKERLLMDALQAKAACEQRLQSASIEPLALAGSGASTATATGDEARLAGDAVAAAVQSAEKLMHAMEPKARAIVLDEFRRAKEDLALLQWHHRKFEERALADKFVAEQARTALLIDTEQHKRDLERSVRETAKLRAQLDEQAASVASFDAQLAAAREVRARAVFVCVLIFASLTFIVYVARRQAADTAAAERRDLDAQAARLQQNLTANALEFARLQHEHSELSALAAKLASRVFDLKQRQEMSELPIRRFAVQRVSPSLLLSPALITVVKNPDSHALLLTVSDGVDERTAHLASLQDVFHDPRGAQKRFCIVFSHKTRMTFESNEHDEIIRDLKEFMRMCNAR